MLKQRTINNNNGADGDENVANIEIKSNSTITSNRSDNILQNQHSAKVSAISCPSEKELRVPCYCEENVWRLAYRRIFGVLPTSSDIILPSSSTLSTKSSLSAASMISNNNSLATTIDKENEQYYAVFVSNDIKCCPMFNQQASQSPSDPCYWDYHVILIRSSKKNNSNINKKNRFAQVLDIDSRLPYPCSLDEYLYGTFDIDFLNKEASHQKYAPMFRVVRAELFIQNFYSDRMHMFQNGKWLSPQPEYDCILTDAKNMKLNNSGHKSNLHDYINMSGWKGKESSLMGEVLSLSELRREFLGEL